MHDRGFTPKAEQRGLAGREQIDRLQPPFLVDSGTRPRLVRGDQLSMRNQIEQVHGYPSSFATLEKPDTSAGGK